MIPTKVILLFDQDGHPIVPTCSPRADARSGSQGWPKATAKRRLASCVLGMSSSLGVKVPCAT